ncbi:MAG: hypothetical protein V3T23_06940 [Nitrososphaerales archaeon]
MAIYNTPAIYAFFVAYGNTYWMDPMYLDSYQRNWERRIKPSVLALDTPTYQYRTIDVIQCHADFRSDQIGGDEFLALLQDQEITDPQTHNTDPNVGRKGTNPADTKAITALRNIRIWYGTYQKQSTRTQRNGIITSVHIVLRRIASGEDPANPGTEVPGFNGGWLDIPNPS